LKRREPDVEITAGLRADEVHFECKPEVHVRGYADAPAVAEWVSERENLPDELKPGVTYRDFAISWRATVRLGDPDSRGETIDTDGYGSQEDQATASAGRSSKRKRTRSLGSDEIRADDPRTWSGRRATTDEL
jgi:hypothetical protein